MPEPQEGPESATGPVTDEILAAIEAAKLPSGPKKLVSRIHELVDQRDAYRNRTLELQTELEEVKGKLQSASSQHQTPANGNGFESNPTVAKINQDLEQVNASLAWLDEHPEGGYVPDGKGGQIEIEAAKARAIRRQMEQKRTELASEKSATMVQLRTQFESAQAEYHQRALKTYPWLFNQKAPEYQTAQNVLQLLPELKTRLPGWELFLGDIVTATHKRLSAGAAKPAGTPPGRPTGAGGPHASVPTRVVTSPTAAAPKVTDAAERREKEAEEAFQESGSPDALKQLFVARRRSHQNASR